MLPTDITAINPLISQIDTQVSGLASLPYVTYRNPGTLLKQANGSAEPSLLKDSVHPDAAGYKILAGAIDGTLLSLVQGGTPATVTLSHPVVATPTSPSFAIIPLIMDDTDEASTETTVETSDHARSFATELKDVASS